MVRVLDVPDEKIRVIPLGVDGRFRPDLPFVDVDRARRMLNLPEKYILYVGNLEPKKNVPTLVRAFAELKRTTDLPHRLVLAGRRAWNCEDVFSTIEAERMAGQVDVIGPPDDDVLPRAVRGGGPVRVPLH